MVGAAIRSTQPLLSSNTVECVVACCTSYPKNVLVICKMVLMGIRSRIACDREIYSASVVDNAISLCSFDDHSTGQLANVMM